MSNLQKAYNLYNTRNGNEMTRKDFIALLISELGLSQNVASAYHNKCKNQKVVAKVEEVIEAVVPIVEENVEIKNSPLANYSRTAKEETNTDPEARFRKRFPGIDDGDYSCVPAFLKK